MWTERQVLSTYSSDLCVNPTSICRLCMLNGGTSMEPIFQVAIASRIAEKISSVTRLGLCNGDGLPATVCQQCLFQLDMADTFIQRCMASDRSLRSMLNQGERVPLYCSGQESPSRLSTNLHRQPSDQLLATNIIVRKEDEAFGADQIEEIIPSREHSIRMKVSGGLPNLVTQYFQEISEAEHLSMTNCFEEEDSEESISIKMEDFGDIFAAKEGQNGDEGAGAGAECEEAALLSYGSQWRPAIENVKCSICSLVFLSELSLACHLKRHKNEGILEHRRRVRAPQNESSKLRQSTESKNADEFFTNRHNQDSDILSSLDYVGIDECSVWAPTKNLKKVGIEPLLQSQRTQSQTPAVNANKWILAFHSKTNKKTGSFRRIRKAQKKSARLQKLIRRSKDLVAGAKDLETKASETDMASKATPENLTEAHIKSTRQSEQNQSQPAKQKLESSPEHSNRTKEMLIKRLSKGSQAQYESCKDAATDCQLHEQTHDVGVSPSLEGEGKSDSWIGAVTKGAKELKEEQECEGKQPQPAPKKKYSQKKYRCSICLSEFANPLSLARHARNTKHHKREELIENHGQASAGQELTKPQQSLKNSEAVHEDTQDNIVQMPKATAEDVHGAEVKSEPQHEGNQSQPDATKYNCSVCLSEFKNSLTLARHLKRHKRVELIENICQDEELLKPQQSSVRCDDLQDDIQYGIVETTSKATSKDGHEIQVISAPESEGKQSQPDVYKCSLCSGNFSSTFNLARHASHKQHCHVRAAKEEPLKLQQIMASSQDLPPTTVERNARKFSNSSKNAQKILVESALKYKGKQSLPVANKYKCSICSLQCRNRFILGRHLKRHKREKLIKQRQRVCVAGQKPSSNLLPAPGNGAAGGNGTITLGIPRIHCSVSPKVDTTIDAPLICKLNEASWEKCFECDLCQKSFFKKSKLTAHILHSHFEQQPFHYDKTDTSGGKLTNHKQSHAVSQDRLLKCKVCHIVPSSKSALRDHMRVHTQERPYKCIWCCFSFKRTYHLNRHMKSHDAGKWRKPQVECLTRGKTYNKKASLKTNKLKHARLGTDLSHGISATGN